MIDAYGEGILRFLECRIEFEIYHGLIICCHEWSAEVEECLWREGELFSRCESLSVADLVRVMCSLLDIPIHETAAVRGVRDIIRIFIYLLRD